MSKTLLVQNRKIGIILGDKSDYISLTDIALSKNEDEPNYIVKNWLSSNITIEFLGIWEQINNPDFKGVEFDAFKNAAGSNSFVLSPQKWIEATHAIGIISKSGRHS